MSSRIEFHALSDIYRLMMTQIIIIELTRAYYLRVWTH